MMPQKPALMLFGGFYQFELEAVNQLNGGGFASATIRLNKRIKVLPENVDDIPTLLDVFEYCEKTSLVNFLFSILVGGVVDPNCIAKQLHIRDDDGFILLRAKLTPVPSIQEPIDLSQSFTQQTFVQRIGKSEFFITGQTYEVTTQPSVLATLSMLHNDLIEDNWQSFKSPQLDWTTVYRAVIRPLETGLMGEYLDADVNDSIAERYMTFNTVFTTEIAMNQLDVSVLVYPKSAFGHDISFFTDDPDRVLFEVPEDDTDPFEMWRQTYAGIFPGFIPIVLRTGGRQLINGKQYIHTYMTTDGKVHNEWALHFIQSNRKNVMNLYPEAGTTNTVSMTIKLHGAQMYHFDASFFPFMQDSANLAIPYSGDNDFPHIIGLLECNFEEAIEDPKILSHTLPNPSGSFLDPRFCADLNQWMGLTENEPWILVNIVSKPTRRDYLVLTAHHPKGMNIPEDSIQEPPEPVPKTQTTAEPRRRWKLFGKV